VDWLRLSQNTVQWQTLVGHCSVRRKAVFVLWTCRCISMLVDYYRTKIFIVGTSRDFHFEFVCHGPKSNPGHGWVRLLIILNATNTPIRDGGN